VNKINNKQLSLVATWLIVVAILAIDQWVKIEVKSNMMLGESISITNWFKIAFVENNGMAYGMTFINKLFLSVFRLVAIACIGWYLTYVIKHIHRKGYVFCLALIFAGALGNMIDSIFYGLIFETSTPFHVASFVPWGHGYADILQGKVVDMFYFPLIVTHYPSWIPVLGGEEFIFFSPVFNVADASISVGVFLLILLYRKELDGISTAFGFKKNKESEDKIEQNKA
jgi:signal peptidase II